MRAHPYHIERPVVRDGSVRWEKVADVWAQAWQKRGRLVIDTGGPEQRITHEVRLRTISTLTAGMRFRRHERHLLIHQIDDVDGRGQFLLCQCEEQVPLLRAQTIIAKGSPAEETMDGDTN